MTQRIGLRHIGRLLKKVLVIIPSANAYDNLVGTIWSQLHGAYDGFEGKIWLPEPNNVSMPIGGGYYDNR